MKQEILEKCSAYRSLRKDIAAKRVSHAYLVISADGVARKAFFEQAAKLLLCKFGGCERCSTCLQLANGSHPDVKYVYEDKITVRDIEVLTEDAELRPVESDKKLYFLDNAEKLRADSQNKLLKTYEEPNSYVTFFLGTAQENAILPTIRSRAKKLYIEPFPSEDVCSVLIDEGMEENEATRISALAQGNFEFAEKMAENPLYRTLFDEAFDMILGLKSSKQAAPYIFSKLFDKDGIAITLDILEIIFSDVLNIGLKTGCNKKVLFRDYDLKELAKIYSPAAIAVINKSINDAREKLFFNINPTTVGERLLFEIMEAKYKWQP